MHCVKEEAKKLIDNLPSNISWDDVIYEIYVKKKIDEGIKAAEEGKLVSNDLVKQRYINK